MEPKKNRTPGKQPASRLSSARIRVLLRVLKRLAIGFGIFLAIVLLTVTVLLLTAPGRTLVLAVAIDQTNQMIPGTIYVQRLEQLNLSGIQLSGIRVLDPDSKEVIRLSYVRIVPDWSEIITGIIGIESVDLRRAWVDLRELDHKDNGLIGAFVKPDQESTAPDSAAPLDFSIRNITIGDIHATLPAVSKMGSLQLTINRLNGVFSLIDYIPSGKIDNLVMTAKRDKTVILSLNLSGQVPSQSNPSTISVEARSGSMALAVNAEGVLPFYSDWDSKPIAVQLTLTGVTASQLAAISGETALQDAFLGDVKLTLEAAGTGAAMTADGELTTNAGVVRFLGVGVEKNAFKATLTTDGLKLNELRRDLPNHSVTTRITAATKGFPPSPMDLEIHLDKTKVDDVPLPEVSAKSRFDGDIFNDLKILAQEEKSKIEIHGNAALTGEAELTAALALAPSLIERIGRLSGRNLSGHLTASGNIQRKLSGHLAVSGQFALNDFVQNRVRHPTRTETKTALAIKQLKGQFSVNGTPPKLRGTLKTQLTRLVSGDQYLDEASLRVEGNTGSIDVALSALGGMGAPDGKGNRPQNRSAALSLEAEIERTPTATHIKGAGKGTIQGRPIRFAIAPTVVTDKGAFQSEGIEIEVASQTLTAEGALSPRNTPGELVIHWGPIVFEKNPFGILLFPDLVGTMKGQIRVTGNSTMPIVHLEVTGKGLGLKNRPLLGLAVQADMNTQSGRAAVQVSLTNPTGLKVAGKGTAAFKGGTHWIEHLTHAVFDVELNMEGITSEIISPYLPPGTIPADFEAQVNLHGDGSMADPRLTAVNRMRITVPGSKPDKVQLQVDVTYAMGLLTALLHIDDKHGRLITLDANIKLPGTSFDLRQLGTAPARAAADGQWKVQLDMDKRPLTEIAFLSLIAKTVDLPPFDAELHLTAIHDGSGEPTVHLQVITQQTGKWRLAECASEGLRLEAAFEHQDSQNRLNIRGTQQGKALLSLDASVPLLLKPVLEGKKPILGELNVELITRRLQLAALPFVCGRAVGVVEANIVGKNLLGRLPEISANVAANKFSLGSRDKLNVELIGTAAFDNFKMNLNIKETASTQKRPTTLKATVPWNFTNGTIKINEHTPFDAQITLNNLPISPLLPPLGAVSYATGKVNGDIHVFGDLQNPRVKGHLGLKKVAFTSTSLAQPFRNINGTIRFKDRLIQIEHLEAHDRDGTVTLKGTVDLSNIDALEGRMEIAATKFPLRRQGQVVAVTSFRAVAKSTVTPQRTFARLTLNDVDMWLESVALRTGIDLTAHQEFVIDGVDASGTNPEGTMHRQSGAADKAIATAEATPETPLKTITIIVEAENRFWVKREDFAVKLNTLLKTDIVGDDVRVNGNVTIDRGYLQLFGRVFDLQPESRIRFIGTNPPNPVLELTADHKPGSGTIVGVLITGRADAPVLTFQINNEVVEAGVAVQALFGGNKGSNDTDAASQAQSFVSGLTAGVLATTARRELGAAAPIVMIDPSQNAGEGRVRAGFELDTIIPEFLRPVVTGVYLEGIVERDSEGSSNTNTQLGALLELYFPKNFFAAAQYGPGTTWSLDFGWQL